MSILRPLQQMPHPQFILPQMPTTSATNPIADAQAAAQAQAQAAMHQTTGQGSAPMPTPVAPSPTGAPASAAAPASDGGMMGSIMKLFGGGGQQGGMDPAAIMQLIGMLG
jgi:hypothetical protein